MGEQPLFSAKAHVFQIDPATKRNWIPAAKHAVTVSFYFDASRSVYRIISVGSTKAIINSTMTPNMTFTKTSQKFGQWADSRVNTVYGLGFSTEQQLQQFSEQFKEVKEAARLLREKSQEKFELVSPDPSISDSQTSQDRNSPLALLCVNGPGEDKLIRSKSADTEPFSEKGQVKKMHSEGDQDLFRTTRDRLLLSVCEANKEEELTTLRESNAKLVAALHEANCSIEQWKKQLAEYQHETDRLRVQVVELEQKSGHPAASVNGKENSCHSEEEMKAILKAKDEEITQLQYGTSGCGELEKEKQEIKNRIQVLEERNTELEEQVQKAEQSLASTVDTHKQVEREVRKVVEVLDAKIFDLNSLRQCLAQLLDK